MMARYWAWRLQWHYQRWSLLARHPNLMWIGTQNMRWKQRAFNTLEISSRTGFWREWNTRMSTFSFIAVVIIYKKWYDRNSPFNRGLEISFKRFHSINPVYPCRLIANITAGYPIFFLQPFSRRLSGGLEGAWKAVSRRHEVSTAIDGDKANKWVVEFTVRLINLGDEGCYVRSGVSLFKYLTGKPSTI